MHELIAPWWLFIVVTLFVVTIATVTIFLYYIHNYIVLVGFGCCVAGHVAFELLLELSIGLEQVVN